MCDKDADAGRECDREDPLSLELRRDDRHEERDAREDNAADVVAAENDDDVDGAGDGARGKSAFTRPCGAFPRFPTFPDGTDE